MTFEIHQDRPVPLTASKCPIINADHARRNRWRQLGTAYQSKERRPAGRQPEAGPEPCARTTAKGETDFLQR
jgi:hypothetical protein